MTLPASGAISLNGVNVELSLSVELGLSATATISMNDTVVRTLFGQPSGSVDMNTGHGKTATIPQLTGSFYSGSSSQQNLSDGSLLLFLNTSGTLTLSSGTGATNGLRVSQLVLVGGGGGSGNDGGGGAGGVLNGVLTMNLGAGSYSCTIGDGGPNNIFAQGKGGDTSFNGYTAIGGCSTQFNAANNNGANGGGTVDSTVCSNYGSSPSGQPGYSGFTAYGGNPGGSHGCGRGSGSGGGATQGGSGTYSAGGDGVNLSIANGLYTKWYSTGGRSSFLGGGTNNANWSASDNTGNGGASNSSGYSGQVVLWITGKL
jgi:hypothetical protein